MRSRATYFCIDIEANGPVPGLYDMVSLGAAVVAPNSNGFLQVQEQYYIEIRPQAPKYDARAAAIHGLDLDHLRQHGLPRAEACRQLSAWVKKHTRPRTDSVFVGHNAPFDWSFVAWTFAAESMPNPFGYKALCTKSLAAGILNIHWFETSKENLQRLLKMPPQDMSQKHRADYDAAYQAELLIKLLNRSEAAP